ncbi:hypothetical protein [Corynebacterium meitnerae]|uniref:Uncharacterized protein n=1 Tax=Corynebacterium meitnerae TaxID=2913498 RepID=A0A9X3RK19_9CORY|nr:hypothetical protein [Corynebacterium meitnerae]MCZ9294650.1 hypothetical protein [Corynebacterium meitnerae]
MKQEPVPEGLLDRALHTAFTTDEWPEWDTLDIVPTTDEPFDLDAFDPFAGKEDTGSVESPESDSDSDSEDSSDSPVLDYPDLGADLGPDLGSDFSSDVDSGFDSGFDSDSSGNYDM